VETMPFKDILKNRRLALKFTQKELAQQVGISVVYLSYLETGRREPTFSLASRLAEVLRFDSKGKDKDFFLSLLNTGRKNAKTNHYLNHRVDSLYDDLRRILLVDPKAKPAREKFLSNLENAVKEFEASEKLGSCVIPIAGWQSRAWSSDVTGFVVKRVMENIQKLGTKRFIVIAAPSQQRTLQRNIPSSFDFEILPQEEPRGLAQAILLTERLIPHESFAVTLPDDLVPWSHFKKMLEFHDRHGCTVIAVSKFKKADVQRTGFVVVEAKTIEKGFRKIAHLQEKPSIRYREDDTTDGSNNEAFLPKKNCYRIVGRYIFTPAIFSALQGTALNPRTGQLELTDALQCLVKTQTIYGSLVPNREVISLSLDVISKDLQEQMLKGDVDEGPKKSKRQ
jgi:transcriptional regulator with XRE-family HTH domain